VTSAQRAVEEYAADDGTSDVFGPNGALVPNVAFGAGGTTRDFIFQNVKQATDLFIMEVNNQGLGWIPAFSAYPYSVGNNAGATNEYGMRGFWLNATTFRVRFGNQGTIPILSTANNGESAWATEFAAGTRFRVRKVSGGAAVGYPVGARNVVGDTTGTAVPAGFIGEQQRAFTAFGTGTVSNTYEDLATITLTPGVWDINAIIQVGLNGATITAWNGFIGTVDGNNSTGLLGGDNTLEGSLPTAAINAQATVAQYRVLVTTSTPYYLKYRAVYSAGNPGRSGRISAVRVG
jgi:hypothetical protein